VRVGPCAFRACRYVRARTRRPLHRLHRPACPPDEVAPTSRQFPDAWAQLPARRNPSSVLAVMHAAQITQSTCGSSSPAASRILPLRPATARARAACETQPGGFWNARIYRAITPGGAAPLPHSGRVSRRCWSRKVGVFRRSCMTIYRTPARPPGAARPFSLRHGFLKSRRTIFGLLITGRRRPSFSASW